MFLVTHATRTPGSDILTVFDLQNEAVIHFLFFYFRKVSSQMRSVLGRTHKCVVCRVASGRARPPFPRSQVAPSEAIPPPRTPSSVNWSLPKTSTPSICMGYGTSLSHRLVLGLTPFQPQVDVTREPAASDSQLTCNLMIKQGQPGEVLSPSRVARARTGGNTSAIGATRRRKLSPSPGRPLPRGHPGLTSCSEPLGIV